MLEITSSFKEPNSSTCLKREEKKKTLGFNPELPFSIPFIVILLSPFLLKLYKLIFIYIMRERERDKKLNLRNLEMLAPKETSLQLIFVS